MQHFMLFPYSISLLSSSSSVGFHSKISMVLGIQVPVALCNNEGNKDSCQLQTATQDKVVVSACKLPGHLNVVKNNNKHSLIKCSIQKTIRFESNENKRSTQWLPFILRRVNSGS